MHRRGVRLRNVHVGAQPVRLRDTEQQRTAFRDQRAHVHIAQRDHARKRRPLSGIPASPSAAPGSPRPRATLLFAAFTAFSNACTLALCASNCAWYVSASCRETAPRCTRFFTAPKSSAPSARWSCPAADLPSPAPSERSLLHVAWPVHLLIQFRRIDLRQQLPRLHPVADVHLAALHVSAGTRQHRRFGDRLNIAWQHQFAFACRQIQPGHVHVGKGLRIRRSPPPASVFWRSRPRQIAGEERDHHQDAQSPVRAPRELLPTAAPLMRRGWRASPVAVSCSSSRCFRLSISARSFDSRCRLYRFYCRVSSAKSAVKQRHIGSPLPLPFYGRDRSAASCATWL